MNASTQHLNSSITRIVTAKDAGAVTVIQFNTFIIIIVVPVLVVVVVVVVVVDRTVITQLDDL